MVKEQSRYDQFLILLGHRLQEMGKRMEAKGLGIKLKEEKKE